jgi:CRP-like cAMP-binding protein
MEDNMQLRHFDNMVLLRNCPFFSGLAPSQLQRLVMLVKEHRYSANEMVLEEGTVFSSLYVVKNGECQVGSTTYSGGDSILEAALFYPNYTLKAPLMTKDDTILITIPQSDLYDLLRNNPETSVRFIERLAGELLKCHGDY